MPRIRTLKPEHKSHRKVGCLSDREYRLWVGLITEADDEGRFVAEADQLRAVIFPYAVGLEVADVTAARDHLALVGLIKLYTKRQIVYGMFPDWLQHQKIDRPRPSILPRDRLRERSSRTRRGSDLIGPDRTRSDRTGSPRAREGERGAFPKERFAHANGNRPGWLEESDERMRAKMAENN
jgi:hypothetical protein